MVTAEVPTRCEYCDRYCGGDCAMARDRLTADLLLEWSRTLVHHGLKWEAWCIAQNVERVV